jgi:NADP-dependent 3-hydroxy acid dehydrogenase YdfG
MSLSDFYDASPRDTYNIIKASQEKQEQEYEHSWDVTRHIMWAAITPHITKKIKVTDLIRLKRDGLIIELDPYDKQQLDEWDRMCDEEMRQAGLLA